MRKLLFLSAELPYPPISGGRIKSWKLLEFLSQHYQLTLACPLKGDDPQHLSALQQHLPRLRVYSHALNVPRSARTLLHSYLVGLPLNVLRTRSKTLHTQVHALIAEHDMVLCDHYETAQYVPADFRGPVILHQHNAYFLMWQRYGATARNPIVRAVCQLEAWRVRRYELRACRRATRIFAAPNDIDTLVAAGAERTRFRQTYHLGDDSTLGCPPLQREHTREQLLYIGTLSWEANVDGLLWFLNEVWPRLRAKRPHLTLKIVGRNPDTRLRAAAQDDAIEFTGFVEDLEPLFQHSRVFIAPLRFGAGIKVKVLSGMGRGLPTVTTSIGVEGLEVQSMHHVAIADGAEENVQAIEHLLDDPALWQRLSTEGRQLIDTHYSWPPMLNAMQRELDAVFDGP